MTREQAGVWLSLVCPEAFRQSVQHLLFGFIRVSFSETTWEDLLSYVNSELLTKDTILSIEVALALS